MANIVVIPGLKGAGDVRFPVFVGILFMWGIGVLGSYIFGAVLHMGLFGIWIAIASDEILRGITMLFRWKSKAWVSKRLVDDHLPAAVIESEL